MKKLLSELAVSFPAFAFVSIEKGVIDFEVPEFKKDASEQILDVVFAPDPWSRLPMNDVAVYLSDKVDPAIREFIGAQLLAPNPKIEGVPDEHSDILFDLVRGSDESVYDYANRINQLIAQDNEIRIKESQINSEV